jgi:hypothetical protein
MNRLRVNQRSNASFHRRTGSTRIGTARCVCGERFPLWRRWTGRAVRYSGFDRLLGHQMRDHGRVVGFTIARRREEGRAA